MLMLNNYFTTFISKAIGETQKRPIRVSDVEKVRGNSKNMFVHPITIEDTLLHVRRIKTRLF